MCSLTRWEKAFYNVHTYIYHHKVLFKYLTILCQVKLNKSETERKRAGSKTVSASSQLCNLDNTIIFVEDTHPRQPSMS